MGVDNTRPIKRSDLEVLLVLGIDEIWEDLSTFTFVLERRFGTTLVPQSPQHLLSYNNTEGRDMA